VPLHRAFAQALQQGVHGSHFEHGRGLAQRNARVVARVNRRHGLKFGEKLQRLAFFQHHIPDVGRRHGLQTPLLQGLVHEPRDQVVGHVIENLVLVALFDDGRGHLALAEAGHLGFPPVVLGHALDFCGYGIGGHLKGQVLLGLGDLGQFSLHLD